MTPACWLVKRESTWVTVLRASCLAAVFSGGGGAGGGTGVAVGERSLGESGAASCSSSACVWNLCLAAWKRWLMPAWGWRRRALRM